MHSLISHLKDEKKLISDNCFSVLKVYFDLIYCKRWFSVPVYHTGNTAIFSCILIDKWYDKY